MMTDYVPIDCGLHSEYELAIMQHRKMELCWCDAGSTVNSGVVTPIDLYTRNGEEFMRVRESSGNELTIRLDRITTCNVL